MFTGLVISLCMLSGMPAVAETHLLCYPGESPGEAVVALSEDTITLGNEALSAKWRLESDRLRFVSFTDKTGGSENKAQNGEVFIIGLTDGQMLKASEFTLSKKPESETIVGHNKARRGAERYGGVRVSAVLRSPDSTFSVAWEADLRDESNYVIQRITVMPADQELDIDTLTLISLDAKGALVAGVTQGAPVTADTLFFAFEHPMSESVVTNNRVSCFLRRGEALAAGRALTLSSVMGVTPPGQRRRGFLYYVERERARPYRQFLHYNSWYDIAWVDRKFNEAEALAAIEVMARALVEKRGVHVDSFVFDDGWDDNATLWQFHDGFPEGFTPLKKRAQGYGSALGVWLSPFGGYDDARKQRLQLGAEQGFEINRNGFSLAGERYYERFHEICVEMIQEHGVNFFKFDGMGPGNNHVGGEEFLEDIEALMRLAGELREIDADLYISATTGTWSTPYFLWHADNTWRCSKDMDFSGKGSKRQQWINYRDTHTYRNVVLQGPLYPLNSLMTQGIVHGTHGPAGLMDDDPRDFADEVWSFFGSGTNLQELYITPQRLTVEQWDILAAGAQWSRANADALVDTHWIGGDPGEHQVYGWASWTPRKGILVLRNPDDKSASIQIDIGSAFELPQGTAKKFRLTTPMSDLERTDVLEIMAGSPHDFRLDAFQTVVYDAEPQN